MNRIPEDLIAEILSRLQVKDLIRNQLVSKPWKTLLKSPTFIKLHLNRTLQNPQSNLSLIIKSFDLYSVDFTTLDHSTKLTSPLRLPYWGTEIAGSCHGVLCVTLKDKAHDCAVALFNPSTKTRRIVPVSPVELPVCNSPGDRRAVEFGFGYDSGTDDYKVIRIAHFCRVNSNRFISEVKIYSLKNNAWRKVKDIPYYIRFDNCYGFWVNERLHWPVTSKPKSDRTPLIMGYDLRTEKCNLISQPDFGKGFEMMITSVLDGCMCVSCNYENVKCDVWVMKEYGVKDSWVKLFSMKQEELSTSFGHAKPVGCLRNGHQVLFEKDNCELILYDLKEKRGDIVHVRGMENKFFDVEVCLRSLVSLEMVDGCEKIGNVGTQTKKKKNGKKSDDFLSAGFKLKL